MLYPRRQLTQQPDIALIDIEKAFGGMCGFQRAFEIAPELRSHFRRGKDYSAFP